MKKALFSAVLFASALAPLSAQLVITEAAPWGSGTSQYAADWFELTNTGSSAVNITNWRFDDNSNSFALSLAVIGITSIAPGESVIFVESTTPATTIANFLATWFGASVPAGLQVGSYSGSGAGLGTGGDAINIFDDAGTVRANISFGASTTGFSFDNAAGINNGAVTTLSAIGNNGALAAFADPLQIGSPGRIAVPEPGTYALLGGAALLLGVARRFRRASAR